MSRSREDAHRYADQFAPAYSRLYEDADLSWIVPFKIRYVIGIIGRRFAGKSAALAYLSEKRGFRVYSLASLVRREAELLGAPVGPRTVLQDIGDDMRAEAGDAGILARRMLRQIRLDHLSHRLSRAPLRIAIGGIKHPRELEVLQQAGRFRAVCLDASTMARYWRAERSGVLAQELHDVAPNSSPTYSAFQEHIDRRDRRGDAGRPWTEGYGQAVDKTLRLLAGTIVVKNEPHGRRARSRKLADRERAMRESRDDYVDLHDCLDEVVANFDREFRTPT